MGILRSASWVIAMTAVTVCGRTATAQEATPVDARVKPEPERSMGGLIFVLDASAIAFAEAGILGGMQPNCAPNAYFASGGGTGPSCLKYTLNDGGIMLLATGGILYGFGAPTVHWVHHQTGAGLASFGLHMLGGVVGGYVAYAEGINGGQPGVAALAALPIFAIPTVVDALFMSSYRESLDSGAPKESWESWVPMLNLRHDGAVAGVDVAF